MSKLDQEAKVGSKKNAAAFEGCANGPDKVNAKGPGTPAQQEATGKMQMGKKAGK